MKNIILISLSITALTLSGCSSNSPKRQGGMPTEVFVTHINPDGSKVFNYSLIKKMPTQGQMGKGMGKGGGMHGGMGGSMKGGKKPDMSKMKAKMEEKANKKLNLKLSETGYCREGYMELDSFFERGHVTIKGECNETATEQDKKTFLNSEN
jgi:hypothetical protein